jgi:hypothetical protein
MILFAYADYLLVPTLAAGTAGCADRAAVATVGVTALHKTGGHDLAELGASAGAAFSVLVFSLI